MARWGTVGVTRCNWGGKEPTLILCITATARGTASTAKALTNSNAPNTTISAGDMHGIGLAQVPLEMRANRPKFLILETLSVETLQTCITAVVVGNGQTIGIY